MEAVLARPQVQPTVAFPGTRDAHGFYGRFGFVRREMMLRPSVETGKGLS